MNRKSISRNESGNIFFAIFGAIALVGLLGAATMTFMKGPLSSAVKLTKLNTAENQMTIGAQVAVMSTTSQPNNGDCDADGFIEPMEWRAATTEPIPTNGGLIPASLGISKKDPWGTEYGYCVWNHGATTSGGGCAANMLTGTNGTSYPVVAIVSAGPDKMFTTTCRTFAVADSNSDGDLGDATDMPLVSKAAETDDDIIQNFTYEEATAASGGLWSLKSGDPATAVIDKNIETTGTASFQGGVLLPDKSLITCDATTAGVMAMNGTAIEICDGAGNWAAITGGGGATVTGNGLVLTPNTGNAMNVNGNCGDVTCYSSNLTFTLTNNITPAATSATLTVSLSNTTNFEKVSDSCHAQTLAAGATCQITIRAKATGNISYTGLLSVVGNNSPFATLDGVGSGFPGCNAGGSTTGGYYVACGVNGQYDLIMTPSGCTGGASNPTCAGGADTFQASASNSSGVGSYSTCCGYTGIQNTANLIGYAGAVAGPNFPAAAYCNSLVYQGYDDWFLPSANELQSYAYPNRTTIGYSAASFYWTSSPYNITQGTQFSVVRIDDGTIGYGDGSNIYRVRCMRRSPAITVNPIPDSTPHAAAIYFKSSTGSVAAETRTSNAITILGVNVPVPVSISGGTNAQYSINGGAYTSVAGTVSVGDTISLRATSPAVGQEQTVSLTVGTYTWTWRVRTAGVNTIRAFLTSNTFQGNFGGVGGADAQCTSHATSAGLPGTWVAVLAGAPYDVVENRLPWNWNRLNNMTGTQVASGLTDFLDGSISAPLNYTQTGAIAGSSLIWTGMDATGIGNKYAGYDSSYNQCISWVTATVGYNAMIGDSAVTSGGGYLYNGGSYVSCSNNYRLLCMELNAAGSDLDPADVSLSPQAVFTSGATGTSNTVTVTSVTSAVNVAISAASGTVGIIKNGVSVGGASTTASINDTLAFTLTAPTVIGTKNTATITIGPDSYTWWVGYADSSRQAKGFVTSIGYRGDNLGSMAGADAICESRAAASPYGLSAKWKALLSDSTDSAANRVPWNWGSLKSLTGTTIVDGGISDLFDGTLDSVWITDETGASAAGQRVWTGSTAYGSYDSSGVHTSCQNWTTYYAYGACGIANNTNTNWINMGNCNANYCSYNYYRFYCVEDVDSTVSDTIPSTFDLAYAIQVPVSSRQSSSSVTISGMSSGATATLSVTATGGNPKFTVNGGGEVSSATVQNGDVVVFKMDAPATGNSSHKMTISAGSTILSYWRVWTGDTTGSLTKRIFIMPITAPTWTGNMGGVDGGDSRCQSTATSASLGGTWKAVFSGINEDEWAVNRIGYNWTTLQQTNGTNVALAGNIWSTTTTPLLNPIVRNAANTTNYSTSWVVSNTNAYGKAVNTTSASSCYNWSLSYYSSYYNWFGTSGVTNSNWIYNNGATNQDCYNGYYNTYYYYCIEQ